MGVQCKAASQLHCCLAVFGTPVHPICDKPLEAESLSPAFMAKLISADLAPLQMLFRFHGVQTLRTLNGLDNDERAHLLHLALDQFRILGFLGSQQLQNKFDALFVQPDKIVSEASHQFAVVNSTTLQASAPTTNSASCNLHQQPLQHDEMQLPEPKANSTDTQQQLKPNLPLALSGNASRVIFSFAQQ